ncbi:MAG: hypothetical protein ABW133_15780 [Polyangiaceae bacterium]
MSHSHFIRLVSFILLLVAGSDAYGQSTKKKAPRKPAPGVTTKAPKRKAQPRPAPPAPAAPVPTTAPVPPTPPAPAVPTTPVPVPSAPPPVAPTLPPTTAAPADRAPIDSVATGTAGTSAPVREADNTAATEPSTLLVTPAARLPLFTFGVEPRWEGRFYRHAEFTAPNVRSYDANGYVAIAGSLELYPLARADVGLWQNLGVAVRYAQAFGFQSNSARLGLPVRRSSLPVDTSFVRYALELRYRMKLRPQSPRSAILGVAAGYGRWDFDFSDGLPRGPDIEAPTADDRMARLGVDLSAAFGPVSIFGAATYLHAFTIVPPSSRELDKLRYLHLFSAVGEGAEFRLGAGLALWRALELRASLEYAVMVYNLKPLEGRNDEPGRVIDSYVSAGLGPYFRF